MVPAATTSSKVLIISGEISGDLFGSYLARYFKELDPDCQITAVGGDRLQAFSDHFVFHCANLSAIGLKERFWKSSSQQALLAALEQCLLQDPPDKAVIIDFQHHNVHLARLLGKFGIPIYTYITPNFWLWKDKKQARQIVAYSDWIYTIFREEYEFYSSLTDRVSFFGHPLVDIVDKTDCKSLAPPQNGFQHFMLFPGSRLQEFKLYLTPMLETVQLLSSLFPQARFSLGLSSDAYRDRVECAISKYEPPIEIVEGSSKDLLKDVDFLLSASGSATLEAVLYGVPMLIYCALPPLTYFAAKYILRLDIPHIALPNIVARRFAVPEYVQAGMVPETMAAHILRLAQDRQAFQELMDGYAEVRTLLSDYDQPIREVSQAILSSKVA